MPAPLPIVGVMPPGVRFLPDPGAASEPNYDVNAKVDFWFGVDTGRVPAGPRRGGNAIARLRDGASVRRGAGGDRGAVSGADRGAIRPPGPHRVGERRAGRPQP